MTQNHSLSEQVEAMIPKVRRAAYFMARRLPAGSSLTAEDLEQEAYVALMRNRRSIRGPMLDAMRSAGWMRHDRTADGKPSAIRLAEDCLPLIDSNAEPEDLKIIRQIDCERALGNLSARQKQAIQLRYFHGETNREGSQHLGIHEMTFHQRVSDGIIKLRKTVTK